MGWRTTILALGLVTACGGTETAPRDEATTEPTTQPTAAAAPDDTAPDDTAPDDTAPDDTAPDDTAPDDTAPGTGPRGEPPMNPAAAGPVSVRVTLVNPTMPAHGSPSRDVAARLDAQVFLRGAPGAELTFVPQLIHELEWALVDEAGARWEPMFLPPPMPIPGGPPSTTVTLGADGEALVGRLSGISGFRRPGAESWQEGLPAGRYRVTVRGFDFGTGARLDAAPVTLTVR